MDRFTFHVSRLMYPAIYSPQTPSCNSVRQRFSVAFPAEDVPDGIYVHCLIPKAAADTILVRASSTTRPRVFVRNGDYAALAAALSRAEAQNRNRDAVLRDLPAELDVEVFEFRTPEHSGRGLRLHSLLIDANDIALD